MQVALHLRRRSQAEPAKALLLLGQRTADLAALLARLACDPLPPVFATADGFLVSLPRPLTGTVGGVLRLRALAPNLFVPVDADLVPALLPAEAADLASRRGLVILPGGRALEFDPTHPVPLAEILSAGELRRDAWQPLPEPAPLADRLTEITLEQPDIPLDDLPAPGDPIGTEDPQPQDVNPLSRALARTTFGAGKTLAWLGQKLGLKGMARAGLTWMQAGLNLAPRLAESVLGKQEASLHELLRAFQRGDIERALRRALPLGGDDRGATPHTGARLPLHDLLYSLRNILGDAGGRGSLWITKDNLYHQLAQEYRRQAELATQRGDFRRAAFIYAKLLRDYRAAAAVLARGGLHHDAATIYLKRLNDPLAAAREFEAAGEVDRALVLYRGRGEHVLAGDLLRRVGEEEEALAEYFIAAEKMVKSGRGHYQAGELLCTHASRLDLAMPYYQEGWARRPVDSPVGCAIRLAQAYTPDGSRTELFGLAAEADAFFAPPGNDTPAAEFYNALARLAARFPQEQVRDALRDCALVGIAAKLRQRAATATGSVDLVSTMLGSEPAWAPAVVNDAQFAVRQAAKHAALAAPDSAGWVRIAIRARIPAVTAVCQAAETGEIFVGFESGEVMSFKPLTGEVMGVFDAREPIAALALTQDGKAVVVLSRAWNESTLTCLVKRLAFGVAGKTTFAIGNHPMLCGQLVGNSRAFQAVLWTEEDVQTLRGRTFFPRAARGIQSI